MVVAAKADRRARWVKAFSDRAVEALAEEADVDLSEVMRAVHGTTLGSNIVIERKGEGVALVTTSGFRDVLQIGREKRYQVYDLQTHGSLYGSWMDTSQS